MSLPGDILDVMIDTEAFYRRVHGRGSGRALLHYGVLSLVSLLIQWLLLSQQITPAGVQPLANILPAGSPLLWWLPVAFALSGFVFAPVYACLIRALLARKGAALSRQEVFRIVAYGFTPSLLTLWIPVFGLLLLFWSVYIIAMGLGVGNGKDLRTNAVASLQAGALTAVLVLAVIAGMGAVLLQQQGLELSLLTGMLLPA